MSNPADKFATPRIAAGALFVDGDRVLLVRKTYGNRWDIPGGYVDHDESPAEACRREIREEIGLERQPYRLLVQDWAPSQEEGDKILFVFSYGDIGADAERIQLDGKELDTWEWVGGRPAERLRHPAVGSPSLSCLRGKPRRIDAVLGTWRTGSAKRRVGLWSPAM